jgi:hypothetical protein
MRRFAQAVRRRLRYERAFLVALLGMVLRRTGLGGPGRLGTQPGRRRLSVVRGPAMVRGSRR